MSSNPQRLLDGVEAEGPSEAVQVLGWEKVRIQIWGDDGAGGGATATVQIETKTNDTDAPWYVTGTTTNPTGGGGSGGAMWVIPAVGLVRVNVTGWSVGKVYAVLERGTLGRI